MGDEGFAVCVRREATIRGAIRTSERTPTRLISSVKISRKTCPQLAEATRARFYAMAGGRNYVERCAELQLCWNHEMTTARRRLAKLSVVMRSELFKLLAGFDANVLWNFYRLYVLFAK